MLKHAPHSPLHYAINQFSAESHPTGWIGYCRIFRGVSLMVKSPLVKFATLLSPTVQRGRCHRSGPRSHHRASWLTPKRNRPVRVSFRRIGMCPGVRGGTQCHPGWWQRSSGRGHRSEMSLMVISSVPRGLHMVKYTTQLLWLLQAKYLLWQVGRNRAPV